MPPTVSLHSNSAEEEAVRHYMIGNSKQVGSYWSDALGWVHRSGADVYSEEERTVLALPVDAAWIALDEPAALPLAAIA
jgi:hypothetical protein